MAQQGGYPPYNGSSQNSQYPPGGYTPNFPPQEGGYVPPPIDKGYPSSPAQGYPQPPQQGYASGYPHGNFPPQPAGPQGPPPAPGYNYGPPQGGYVPPGYVPPGYVQPGMGGPQPIMQQPGQGMQMQMQQAPGGWMNIPQGLTNCPPGLEYLSMIDQLLVHQKVEILEALTGFETNNKFTVKNNVGQKVYYAVEDNDCCTRNMCGSMRPFEMKILDNYRNQVINVHRPLACDCCCFPCCLQSIEVSAPPGTIVGFVEQEWSLCRPWYSIKNANGEVVLKIKGPICRLGICGDIEFEVLSKDGETVVGKISKQWSGLMREMFTDSDYFGITFPMDLDVRMKAVLLGACFLIDAMFFEKSDSAGSDLNRLI